MADKLVFTYNMLFCGECGTILPLAEADGVACVRCNARWKPEQGE